MTFRFQVGGPQIFFFLRSHGLPGRSRGVRWAFIVSRPPLRERSYPRFPGYELLLVWAFPPWSLPRLSFWNRFPNSPCHLIDECESKGNFISRYSHHRFRSFFFRHVFPSPPRIPPRQLGVLNVYTFSPSSQSSSFPCLAKEAWSHSDFSVRVAARDRSFPVASPLSWIQAV